MVGTVAGNLITGDITSAIGDGTFYLEYPSTAPLGHLLLEGTVGYERFLYGYGVADIDAFRYDWFGGHL